MPAKRVPVEPHVKATQLVGELCLSLLICREFQTRYPREFAAALGLFHKTGSPARRADLDKLFPREFDRSLAHADHDTSSR